VQWRFPQGTLSMAFNLGNTAQALPDMPGETLFAWPQEQHELAQNAIIVRLAPGAAA